MYRKVFIAVCLIACVQGAAVSNDDANNNKIPASPTGNYTGTTNTSTATIKPDTSNNNQNSNPAPTIATAKASSGPNVTEPIGQNSTNSNQTTIPPITDKPATDKNQSLTTGPTPPTTVKPNSSNSIEASKPIIEGTTNQTLKPTNDSTSIVAPNSGKDLLKTNQTTITPNIGQDSTGSNQSTVKPNVDQDSIGSTNQTTIKPNIVQNTTEASKLPKVGGTINSTINQSGKTTSNSNKNDTITKAASVDGTINSGVPKWKVILITFLVVSIGACGFMVARRTSCGRGSAWRAWRERRRRPDDRSSCEVQYLVIRNEDDDL